jgi:hypothetical protein
MKFFKQDEEIFEPAPQARIAAVPDVPRPEPVKTEMPKGAKVIIRRASETSIAIEAPLDPIAETPKPETPVSEMPPPVSAAAEPAPAPAQAETPQKRRIVIIRHKPGEDIDVPLQNEMAEAS